MDSIRSMNQLYSQSLQQLEPLTEMNQVEINSDQQGEGFSNVFNQAIAGLEQQQAASNQAIQSVIDGTADDLHTVMIQTTEAQLSLEMAVQLRNRALEAYNEIQNMQF